MYIYIHVLMASLRAPFWFFFIYLYMNLRYWCCQEGGSQFTCLFFDPPPPPQKAGKRRYWIDFFFLGLLFTGPVKKEGRGAEHSFVLPEGLEHNWLGTKLWGDSTSSELPWIREKSPVDLTWVNVRRSSIILCIVKTMVEYLKDAKNDTALFDFGLPTLLIRGR